MAGEWIKVDRGTPDKPEIFKMARQLKCDRDLVFGKLIRLWAWFDQNSVDGVVDGMVSTDVDAVVDMDEFFNALKSVNWCDSDDENARIWLTNFDRHNGETAKKRALKNNRQARYREGLKGSDGRVDTSPSTDASTREEKRREEVKKKNKKKKHPLPESFELTESMIEWFNKQNFTIEVHSATEKWKNSMWGDTDKYQKTDWVATWRNGMHKAQEWLNQKQGSNITQFKPMPMAGSEH